MTASDFSFTFAAPPTWSPWAWVRTTRWTSGNALPIAARPASMRLSELGIPVSISVTPPSSSRIAKLLTKSNGPTGMRQTRSVSWYAGWVGIVVAPRQRTGFLPMMAAPHCAPLARRRCGPEGNRSRPALRALGVAAGLGRCGRRDPGAGGEAEFRAGRAVVAAGAGGGVRHVGRGAVGGPAAGQCAVRAGHVRVPAADGAGRRPRFPRPLRGPRLSVRARTRRRDRPCARGRAGGPGPVRRRGGPVGGRRERRRRGAGDVARGAAGRSGVRRLARRVPAVLGGVAAAVGAAADRRGSGVR